MPEAPRTCPNCGVVWPPGARVCPQCGYVQVTLPVWPPPPGRDISSVPPRLPPLPVAKGDFLLGLGIDAAPLLLLWALTAAFGMHLWFGLLLAVPPILYFVLRPRLPGVARGLGIGILIGLLLLPVLAVLAVILLVLGVLSVCKPNYSN